MPDNTNTIMIVDLSYSIILYNTRNLHLSQGMFEVCLLRQPPLSWNGTLHFPWGVEMTPCTFSGIK